MHNLPRICFFGCGHIARQHAGILKKLFPKIELYFTDSDHTKSREYAALFRGAGQFREPVEAAASGFFDIAFITTPHAYHADLAVLAAQHGKHLIIEKPVARSIKELASIEQAVRKYRVRCTVAENYYYKPIIAKIRSALANGYIGKPLHIRLGKHNYETITGWRTDAKLMGGGALLEGGVHWVNALVSLADSSPVEVIAHKADIQYETTVPCEDTLLVTVRYRNGMIGSLFHSWRIPNRLKGISLSKIYGTDGVITFESNGLFYKVNGKKRAFGMVNPGDFLGFKAMHRAFVADYISGKEWKPSLERIRTELQLVEAAYKSLKTKRMETIRPIRVRTVY